MEKALSVIKNHIDLLLAEKGRVLVAIDGKCTSGKTTLAGMLAEHYACNLFHMDDFFLQPQQRTPERYAQAGGNVDYERFWEEVLLPLKNGEPFSYRPFDCKTLSLKPPVSVPASSINIIEGSYSMHPFFGDPYDLKILLTVDDKTQQERILRRPAFLQEQFFQKWIPMENQYLKAFSIAEKADIIL